MRNLTSELWKEAEDNKEKHKLWGKVYNWLNQDNLGKVVLENKIFWFQLNPCSSMPNYIYHFLVKWGESKGFVYLYTIKENTKL